MARLSLFVVLVLLVSGAQAVQGTPPVPTKRQAPAAWGAPGEADVPATWPPDEIAAAQRACISVISRGTYELEALDPIREGACGAPAPVALSAIPGEAKLAFRPAATLTCEMTARLRDWVERVLQPTAVARLGAPITRMRLMGTYSCRRRYNDPDTKLSQHALAKAVDIAAFRTAEGEVVSVLDHWAGDDERAAFLRDIHTGACQIFDTVLGPRANAAHENHFHFDIGSGGICE